MTTKSVNSKPESTTSRLDSLKWGLAVLLVVSGVYGNYYFSAESLLYRVAGLLVLGLIASVIALQTAAGRRFWALLRDAKTEIRRVVWPTRQETIQTTMVVIVVVLVMGLILWALDSLLAWATSNFIG